MGTYYVAGKAGLINGEQCEVGQRLTTDIGALENLRRLVDLGIVVPQHEPDVKEGTKETTKRGENGRQSTETAVVDDDPVEDDEEEDMGPFQPGSGPDQQDQHDAEIVGHETDATRGVHPTEESIREGGVAPRGAGVTDENAGEPAPGSVPEGGRVISERVGLPDVGTGGHAAGPAPAPEGPQEVRHAHDTTVRDEGTVGDARKGGAAKAPGKSKASKARRGK
jgi:hypothetical protein